MKTVFLACVLIVAAYLLGSIPWGLLLTRWVTAQDVRTKGSGNIGATNVSRVAGRVVGGLTLLLDMLKGAVPVYIALWFFNGSTGAWGEVLAGGVALSAFMGHLFPVFLKFKTGGKGVATALGCFLVISPGACACAMIIFCLVFRLCRYVSVASLSASISLPVFILLWGDSGWFSLAGVITALFIFIRHAPNIRRLLDGAEPVYGRQDKQ